MSIAQDEYPGLDTQSVLSDIDALAERLKRRVAVDASPLQRVRQLNQYFFNELGFGGNVNNYYDPRNSFVHEVLLRRRGIPITLAIIYVELATQIGLNAQGISFPGHFLVKLSVTKGAQAGDVVIDPFTGQSLSGEELEDRLGPYRRSQSLMGELEAPLSLGALGKVQIKVGRRVSRGSIAIFFIGTVKTTGDHCRQPNQVQSH